MRPVFSAPKRPCVAASHRLKSISFHAPRLPVVGQIQIAQYTAVDKAFGLFFSALHKMATDLNHLGCALPQDVLSISNVERKKIVLKFLNTSLHDRPAGMSGHSLVRLAQHIVVLTYLKECFPDTWHFRTRDKMGEIIEQIYPAAELAIACSAFDRFTTVSREGGQIKIALNEAEVRKTVRWRETLLGPMETCEAFDIVENQEHALRSLICKRPNIENKTPRLVQALRVGIFLGLVTTFPLFSGLASFVMQNLTAPLSDFWQTTLGVASAWPAALALGVCLNPLLKALESWTATRTITPQWAGYERYTSSEPKSLTRLEKLKERISDSWYHISETIFIHNFVMIPACIIAFASPFFISFYSHQWLSHLTASMAPWAQHVILGTGNLFVVATSFLLGMGFAIQNLMAASLGEQHFHRWTRQLKSECSEDHSVRITRIE